MRHFLNFRLLIENFKIKGDIVVLKKSNNCSKILKPKLKDHVFMKMIKILFWKIIQYLNF